MKQWLSIDPANKSGLAYWVGPRLNRVTTLRAVGKSGTYTCDGFKRPSKVAAWVAAICIQDAVVVEEGFGEFKRAIASQGELRGYIKACADASHPPAPFIAVNVSEWRRCIKEAWGVSWPRESARCKALSKLLVKQRYGLDVSDDEADAVLIGVAAMRMRLVDVDNDQAAKEGR